MLVNRFDLCGSLARRFYDLQSRFIQSADRRSDGSPFDVQAKVVGAVDQLIFVGRGFGLQLKIKYALVANFARPKVFGDETDRESAVPTRSNTLLDADCFKSVFFNLKFAGAVIGKRHRNGRIADRLFVDRNERTFGLRFDDQPSLNAARVTDRHTNRHTCHHVFYRSPRTAEPTGRFVLMRWVGH